MKPVVIDNHLKKILSESYLEDSDMVHAFRGINSGKFADVHTWSMKESLHDKDSLARNLDGSIMTRNGDVKEIYEYCYNNFQSKSRRYLNKASIRTKAKLFFNTNESEEELLFDKHNNVMYVQSNVISETDKVIIKALEAEKIQKDVYASTRLLSTFVFNTLNEYHNKDAMKRVELTINDFFFKFLVKNFSPTAKASLIRITKPYKDKFPIRENLIDVFRKELLNINYTQEQVDDILESID